MSLEQILLLDAVNGEPWSVEKTKSRNYKHWISNDDERRCKPCADKHGQIYKADEEPETKPPIHYFCRCVIEPMEAIKAGTATKKELDGADWWIKHNGALPNYYIDKVAAEQLGWKPGKWPSNFIPNGMMISGGIYCNDDGHLPQKAGRIWYEADINYKTGRRNSQRLIYSNDGLIFVTYDHYEKFYEIV